MPETRSSTVPPRRTPKLDEEIDRNLKLAFQDLVNEPVPDRFKDLLKRLEEADTSRPAGQEEPGAEK